MNPDDALTICPDCNMQMEFQCMYGTEAHIFEEWRCPKCTETFQIEMKDTQPHPFELLPPEMMEAYLNQAVDSGD